MDRLRFSSRVTLKVPELVVQEGRADRLSPEELGVLTRQLAKAASAAEAARLRIRLTRGFYGI
jgi:hypothetical protein